MTPLLCFSAEASFTTAVLLAVLGFATLSETKSRREIFLGSIPILFAVQQFSEGVLWVTLRTGYYPTAVSEIAKWVFLFFAFVNWPIWLPSSLYLIERDQTRRKIILASLFIGLTFVIWNLVIALGDPVTVDIVQNSIQYSAYETSSTWIFLTLRILYIAAVLIPCFASGLAYIWLFGLLVAGTFIAAEFYYHVVFTSVWCFFAAVTSAALYFVLKQKR